MKPVQDFLRKKKCLSAILIKREEANPNFTYLSGFFGIGVLLIRQRSKPLLFVPEAEHEIAKRESSVTVINSGAERIIPLINKRFPGTFNSCALDKSSITANDLSSLKKALGIRKAIDISETIEKMREIKTPEEIRAIKAACRAADRILQKIIRNIAKYQTEADIASALLSETLKQGLAPSFDPIVASGKNSSNWHHFPKTKKISKGFLMIDFGVKLNGYCSDITRTIYIGKPSPKEQAAYLSVLNIQKECIAMLHPGAKLKDIQDHAKRKLGDRFVHSLGHGIGRAVHERPNFTGTAKPGMCLAVEPGIYYPGKFGIRIEDDVLITSQGPRLLTASPKNLISI